MRLEPTERIAELRVGQFQNSRVVSPAQFKQAKACWHAGSPPPVWVWRMWRPGRTATQLDRTNQDYSAALFGPAVSSDQDLAQVATSEERQQDAYLTEVLNSVDHPPLLTAFLQYDSSTTTTTPSGKTMEISYTLRSNGAASQTTADIDASEAATPTGLTGPDGLKGGITVTLRQSGDHDLITHVDQGID